jgi:hypothetical protein
MELWGKLPNPASDDDKVLWGSGAHAPNGANRSTGRSRQPLRPPPHAMTKANATPNPNDAGGCVQFVQEKPSVPRSTYDRPFFPRALRLDWASLLTCVFEPAVLHRRRWLGRMHVIALIEKLPSRDGSQSTLGWRVRRRPPMGSARAPVWKAPSAHTTTPRRAGSHAAWNSTPNSRKADIPRPPTAVTAGVEPPVRASITRRGQLDAVHLCIGKPPRHSDA